MSIRPLFLLGLISLAPLASLNACTSLTTPPEPEEIASSTTTVTAGNAALSAQTHAKPAPTASDSPPPPAAGPEGKLEIKTTAPGTGAGAKAGDTIAVDYVGKLADGGKEFDHSPPGKPFTLKLGAGMVIPGWDQGLVGMKQGEKRKLTIPPSLAYKERGHPPQIPGNSTLVFEVTMEKITPGQ